MQEELEYSTEDFNEASLQSLNENLQSLEFKLTCEIGNFSLTINELLNLSEGNEIAFNQTLQKIRLKINDKIIGFGKLVIVQDKTAIQITELLLKTDTF